jgi:hypothetical protein
MQRSCGPQILNVGSNHWLTLNKSNDAITFADSLQHTLHGDVNTHAAALFGNVRLKCLRVQRQKGSNDCGLFALAFAEAHSRDVNPAALHFKQEEMRAHFLECLLQREPSITPFPSSPAAEASSP